MVHWGDMHDTIIIGGGPAGIAAGIYSARKQLKTVLIAEEIGGQSTVSEGIENGLVPLRSAVQTSQKHFIHTPRLRARRHGHACHR